MESASSTLRLSTYSSCASALPTAKAVFIMPMIPTGFGAISTNVVCPAASACSVASWNHTGWRVMRRKYWSSWMADPAG